MSLRARITIIAAAAVAIAVIATSLGVYAVTARTLSAGTDEQLDRIAAELTVAPRARPDIGRRPGVRGFQPGPRAGSLGGAGGFIQLLDTDGEVVDPEATTLPVSDQAATIATDPSPVDLVSSRRFETVTTDDGTAVRVLTVPIPDGGAFQVGLPVDDTAIALARLRRQLAIGSIAGVVLAALLGSFVARRAVRPVGALTDLAEDVALTSDLSRRIDLAGDDEIGRLATTFNGMLANLEQARAAQQQLIADASHELRTPLTSLRTNIEVLEQADRLSESSRRELIADVVGQLAEFGRLIDGLVELARGSGPARAATDVDLAEVVGTTVARLRRFAPDREFVLDLSPTTVTAEADRLERAVANLIDNAIKYGDGPIHVSVDHGVVRVRDHGPGIATEDLPHVFDRFYRSPEARSAPGSGLGLSIVAQVADSHGGEVQAANAPDGGALLTLRLPTVDDPAALATVT